MKSKTEALKPHGRAVRTKVTAGTVRLLAYLTPYIESEMLGLAKVVKAGDVCIDVGAAAGLYTLELSRLVGPKGQVLSIEPLSFAHPVVSRILGNERHANLTWHAIALGDEPGESVMSVPMGRFGPITGRSFLARKSSGLGSNAEFASHMNVDIKVDTLDKLCEREKLTRVDFIKIDIEGAELHALQGGKKTIERFKPTLLIEIEARHLKRFKYSPEDIVKWLKERDYKMYVWNLGWQETDKVALGTRNYLFRAR